MSSGPIFETRRDHSDQPGNHVCNWTTIILLVIILLNQQRLVQAHYHLPQEITMLLYLIKVFHNAVAVTMVIAGLLQYQR